ncbi:MAG: hypothetical protein QM734_06275 [Cyclobacteriaceae bacterium]
MKTEGQIGTEKAILYSFERKWPVMFGVAVSHLMVLPLKGGLHLISHEQVVFLMPVHFHLLCSINLETRQNKSSYVV